MHCYVAGGPRIRIRSSHITRRRHVHCQRKVTDSNAKTGFGFRNYHHRSSDVGFSFTTAPTGFTPNSLSRFTRQLRWHRTILVQLDSVTVPRTLQVARRTRTRSLNLRSLRTFTVKVNVTGCQPLNSPTAHRRSSARYTVECRYSLLLDNRYYWYICQLSQLAQLVVRLPTVCGVR